MRVIRAKAEAENRLRSDIKSEHNLQRLENGVIPYVNGIYFLHGRPGVAKIFRRPDRRNRRLKADRGGVFASLSGPSNTTSTQTMTSSDVEQTSGAEQEGNMSWAEAMEIEEPELDAEVDPGLADALQAMFDADSARVEAMGTEEPGLDEQANPGLADALQAMFDADHASSRASVRKVDGRL